MSNGVKWYTPDVFAGPVYVPEEMETVTQDVSHEVVSKRTLTDEQFQSALVKIQDGQCIKGSTVTVYDWIRTECELTEQQNQVFNLLNTTDNGTN